MNLHFPVIIAAFLLYGPMACLLTYSPALLSAGIRRRTPIRIPFNLGQNALSLLIASQLLYLGNGGVPATLDLSRHLPLLLGVILVYDVLSIALVAGAVALLTGEKVQPIFISSFFTERLKIIPLYYPTGIILALIFQNQGTWGALLMALPLLSTFFILRDQKIIYESRQKETIDPLTGLYNRRYLQEWFSRNLPAIIAEGRDLSILMLDIDDFKRINDNFGHQVGDQTLIRIASTLNNTVRNNDPVFRYGGEEFLIILPDTPATEAYQIGERVRCNISQMSPPGAGPSSSQLTASLGLTSIAGQEEDQIEPEELLRQADKATYLAKFQGKNRTYSYSQFAKT